MAFTFFLFFDLLHQLQKLLAVVKAKKSTTEMNWTVMLFLRSIQPVQLNWTDDISVGFTSAALCTSEVQMSMRGMQVGHQWTGARTPSDDLALTACDLIRRQWRHCRVLAAPEAAQPEVVSEVVDSAASGPTSPVSNCRTSRRPSSVIDTLIWRRGKRSRRGPTSPRSESGSVLYTCTEFGNSLLS